MPTPALRRLLVASTVSCFLVSACGDGGPGDRSVDAASDVAVETTDAEPADALTDAADLGDDAADAASDADTLEDTGSDASADTDSDVSPDAADTARPDAGTADAPYVEVPGPPGALAVDVLLNVGPFMINDDERAGTLAVTRLDAVLASGVTVADFNAALASAGAAVATARTASPAVTLLVPAVADTEAARALATALEASGAFAAVLPSFPPEPDTVALPGTKEAPNGASQTHELTRLHAAWNLADLVTSRIPVMVADCYVELRPHPEISAQSFRINALTGPHARLTSRGQISGNHGFWVSSILGADIADPSTGGSSFSIGTSLDPVSSLELLAVQTCGLTWTDILTVVEDFHVANPAWVLNASIGYNDPAEVDESRTARATYALLWRAALRRMGAERVLVVAAAGNDGNERPAPMTDVTSPFGTQALVADVRDIVQPGDRARIDAVAASLGLGADATRVVGHTVMVGSSDAAGGRSSFSTPGEHVRTLGENVAGYCLIDDVAGPGGAAADPPRCVSGEMFSSGSSAAAPQVAGIAAMWLGASSAETAASVRARLIGASTSGTVDAFEPMMSVLHDAGLDVLSLLCDVNVDALCDEADVGELLERWSAVEETPGGDLFETWGRHDLNGDGFERTDRGRPFDLDFDGSALGTVTFDAEAGEVALSELDATDLTVLCAAAYGDSWAGGETTRDELLADLCGLEGRPPLTEGTTWFGTIDYAAVSLTTPIPGACTSSPQSGGGTTTMSARIECAGEPGVGALMSCTLIDGSWSASGTLSTELGPWGASPRILGTGVCDSNADCGGTVPNCLAQGLTCGESPSDAPGVCGACVTYSRAATEIVTSASADLSEQRGAMIALVGFVGDELRVDVFSPAAEGTQTTTTRIESFVEGEDAARPCVPAGPVPEETIELFGFGGDVLVAQALVTRAEGALTATASSDRESVAADGLSSTGVSTSMILTLRAVVTP